MDQARSQNQEGRLGGLDVLRFVAVYFIFLNHLGYKSFAGFGVPVLMALSGFLITRQLLRELDRTGGISSKQFVIARILRIAPAYFTFVGISWVADRIMGNPWPDELLWFALTHTVNYFNALNGHPNLIIVHVWTLSVLEQFYLVWPVVLSAICARGSRTEVVITMIAIALAWRVVAYTVVFPDNIAWINNATDCRLDSILLGCAVALRVHETGKVPLRSWGRLGLLCIIGASLIAIEISKSNRPWHYSFGFLAEAGAAMALILALSQLSNRPLFGWLSRRELEWLGKISYPFFLYHQLAIGFAKKYFEAPLVVLVVATFVAILASSGSYMLLERPVMQYRQKLRDAWRRDRPNGDLTSRF